MEGELIYLGFIMLIGQVILLQMWQHNWFKKENFKIQASNIKAENRIKLKRLEKELGITSSTKTQMSEPGGWLDFLRGVKPEQARAFLNMISPAAAEGYEEELEPETDDIVGSGLKMLENNPEAIKKLTKTFGSLLEGGSKEAQEKKYLGGLPKTYAE